MISSRRLFTISAVSVAKDCIHSTFGGGVALPAEGSDVISTMPQDDSLKIGVFGLAEQQMWHAAWAICFPGSAMRWQWLTVLQNSPRTLPGVAILIFSPAKAWGRMAGFWLESDLIDPAQAYLCDF
jgi:hypothetical protein